MARNNGRTRNKKKAGKKQRKTKEQIELENRKKRFEEGIAALVNETGLTMVVPAPPVPEIRLVELKDGQKAVANS